MKAESLKGWGAVEVNGGPLLETLEQRVSLMFIDFVPLPGTADGVPAVVPFPFASKKGGVIVAVPVAADGYFLTVAHAVMRASSLTIVLNIRWEDDRPKFQAARARVVWEPRRFWVGGADFAIVHANVGTLVPITMDAGLPLVDDSIVTAGAYPTIRADAERLRFSAGRILSVHERRASQTMPVFVAVRHDAPTVPGDSGGPVLNRKGNLIGISSYGRTPIRNWISGFLNPGRTQFDMRGHYSVAFMPDPHWVREVIERDRRSRIHYQDALNEAGK